MQIPSTTLPPAVEQFSEQLLALGQLLWENDAPFDKSQAVNQAVALNEALRDFCMEALIAGGEPADQLNAAYLRALFHDNNIVRHTLHWFLDNFLGHGMQLVDQPHTLTISITGYADMAAIPYGGAFDVAPMATWISESLLVPVEAIGVQVSPMHPDECLLGLCSLASTALRTKRPSSLAEDNAACTEMVRPDQYEEVPLIFVATLHLKDSEDIDRVLARIRESIADASESTAVPLGYRVGGQMQETKLESPIIDLPFAGFVDCVFDEVRDELAAALDQLDEQGIATADLGVDFRTVDDLDDEAGPRCRYEIYLREGKVRKLEGYGVPIEQGPFFHDTFIDLFEHFGVGEIAIASKVVYVTDAPAGEAPAAEPNAPL